jgi:hypothetical protein
VLPVAVLSAWLALPGVALPGLPALDELLPGLAAVAVLLEGWLFIEPCVFVSAPVALVEVVPAFAVAVSCVVLPWVPAVDAVPETDPACGVAVSFDDVLVLLLLLLQPKTNAAASARPYAYFMCCLLKGFRGALVGPPQVCREATRLLSTGRHRAAAMEASRAPGLSRTGRARRRCARTLSELSQHLQHGPSGAPVVPGLRQGAGRPGASCGR